MSDLDSTTSLCGLFADPTRLRLMTLVADCELTVAELTEITRLPQPRVSTHLGKLKEAGLLRDRRVGSSTFYTMNTPGLDQELGNLWSVLHSQLDDAVLADDRRRREAVVRAREQAEAWPEAVAGQMERHYSPGRTWEAMARGFLGLIRLGHVLDIGSGDGAVAQLLAPRCRSITCLDRSPKVIEAARQRLSNHKNVAFFVGDMHDLPFDAASFDHVLLFNVLTYAQAPELVIDESARVLRPGGDIVIVVLRQHQHSDLAAAYRHVNGGFAPSQLRALLETAGLHVDCCDVTSRERRRPYFEVISAFARKPARRRAERGDA